MAQRSIAIDIDRRVLRAVEADRDGRALRVRRLAIEPVPGNLDADDPQALGTWMRRRLEAAHFPRDRATLAIARGHVALKRMALPTTSDAELPAMTSLALRRELPFDASGAVIDYVCLDRGEHSTTVLAAAVPHEVLEFARRLAKAAGLGVERISLRTMGSAALLGGLPHPDGGGTLAVDIAAHRVEFSVIADGAIRFSRAGDLPEISDPVELADAVITETRRTWMSYRIVDDSEEVRRAMVFGDREITAHAAGSIGQILKVPAEVLQEHPLVDTGGHHLDSAWPLAGLLLEPGLEREAIDFMHPRKAPDLAGRKRKLVLGALGLVVVAVLGAFTIGRALLAGLEETAETLDSKVRTLAPQFARYGRDLYKLSHLEQWDETDVDWLGHFAYIVQLAPPPDQLVLDGISGSVRFAGVAFDRKSKHFSAPREIRIVLEGEAADRSTADAFRGALVATDTYEIATTGPDTKSGRRLPYAFTYHLRTTLAAPPTSDGDPGRGQEMAARLDREPAE